MHVLMLTGDLGPASGGPPQVMFSTARGLAARGMQVTLAALVPEGASPATDPDFGALPVTIERFARSGPRVLGRSRALRRTLVRRIGEFDALHVHGIWEGCLAEAAAIFRGNGKPVFVSAHGMLDPWSLRQSRWRKRLALALTGTRRMLAQATALVFATRDESAQAVHPGNARHEIVPNGIDLTLLEKAMRADPQALLERAPLLREPGRTILYFSRIHPKKGLDLLVEAFCRLAPAHPAARLLVVGIPQDENFRFGLVRRVAAAGLQDRVAFVTDLAGAAAKPALAKATVFVLPSHQEGFSIAILEALGAGVPVLITDRCHFPEVAEWDAGRVVPDTPAGIEKGLAALLELDSAELAAMGAHGRTAIAAGFTVERIAAQLEALYVRAAR